LRCVATSNDPAAICAMCFLDNIVVDNSERSVSTYEPLNFKCGNISAKNLIFFLNYTTFQKLNKRTKKHLRDFATFKSQTSEFEVDRLPDNANSLEECNVHEADGSGVVVNQVEPVDTALHTNPLQK
jgi:hypothetical protein